MIQEENLIKICSRVANQILARVAKSMFTFADTELIIECKTASANLAFEKLILRLTKLVKAIWKTCTPLDIKKTESGGKNIIT